MYSHTAKAVEIEYDTPNLALYQTVVGIRKAAQRFISDSIACSFLFFDDCIILLLIKLLRIYKNLTP